MKRIDVWLDKETREALEEKARTEHRSMSAVAIEILGTCLQDETQADKLHRLSFIGAGSSGRTDISINHDEALAEDFR